MSENHIALIAWLKTSPDPFGDIALDPNVMVASVKALLQICPDPKTEHLAYKALNTAQSAANSMKSTGESIEIAYQLVRISVSRAARDRPSNPVAQGAELIARVERESESDE